jgi:hypothetical protein
MTTVIIFLHHEIQQYWLVSPIWLGLR